MVKVHNMKIETERLVLRSFLENDAEYELTKEGVQPSHRNVDRAAIAQCMADMIADETTGANESLGITNGKTR